MLKITMLALVPMFGLLTLTSAALAEVSGTRSLHTVVTAFQDIETIIIPAAEKVVVAADGEKKPKKVEMVEILPGETLGIKTPKNFDLKRGFTLALYSDGLEFTSFAYWPYPDGIFETTEALEIDFCSLEERDEDGWVFLKNISEETIRLQYISEIPQDQRDGYSRLMSLGHLPEVLSRK